MKTPAILPRENYTGKILFIYGGAAMATVNSPGHNQNWLGESTAKNSEKQIESFRFQLAGLVKERVQT